MDRLWIVLLVLALTVGAVAITTPTGEGCGTKDQDVQSTIQDPTQVILDDGSPF